MNFSNCILWTHQSTGSNVPHFQSYVPLHTAASEESSPAHCPHPSCAHPRQGHQLRCHHLYAGQEAGYWPLAAVVGTVDWTWSSWLVVCWNTSSCIIEQSGRGVPILTFTGWCAKQHESQVQSWLKFNSVPCLDIQSSFPAWLWNISRGLNLCKCINTLTHI